MMLSTNILDFFWVKGDQLKSTTSSGHGATWERGELGAGGLTFSERCGWYGFWFTVILEISGSCSLKEMRRQVASRKKKDCYF